MKNRFNIVFRIAAVMFAGAAMTACLKDNVDNLKSSTRAGANEEISILLSVPGAETPSTRSMDGAGENKVTDVDVLVFNVSGTTETFAYCQKGTYVTSVAPAQSGDPYKAKFKVNLMVEDSRKIVVVANARALIGNLFDGNAGNGEITDGMAKTDVLKLLQTANAAKWNATTAGYTPIPMYGETPNAVDIEPGDNFTMSLVRMLARIDVHNAVGSNFKINKVYLANPMTKGYIAPAWDANGKTSQAAATAVNMESAWTNPTGSLVYDMSAVATGTTGNQQSYESEIYTFESRPASDGSNPSDDTNPDRLDATCLIVEGVYSGVTYFYRVDFTYGDENDALKGAYMPLLRNYKYQVVVTKADGIGYKSYNEALNSYTVQSNLHTRIIHYDESVLTNVVSNGQYMLGVEMTEMKIDWTGTPVNNLIVTDYDYTYSANASVDPVQHENGWYIVGYSTDGTEATLSATKPTWFFEPAMKETFGSGRCNLKVCARMNVNVTDVNADINYSTQSTRTAYIHIQAGRLTQVIKVTQGTHTQLINMPRQYPNSYMLQPGGTVLIPTLKPWLVWQASMAAGGLNEPLHPCDPVTCEIVWQDTANLIAELALADGGVGANSQLYVRATPGKSGNAVVAVKVNNVIVWSWHIWVSTYEPGDGVGVKKLMDRNMGALMTSWVSWSSPGSFAVNPAIYLNPANTVMGVYYQYGRKEPFYPRSVYGTARTLAAVNTLKQSVVAPTQLITNWTSPVGAKAWDTGNAAAPKTIHDPCPYGWVMPYTGIFGVANSNDSNPVHDLAGAAFGGFAAFANGGRIFDSGFYPVSGVIRGTDGAMYGGTVDVSGCGGALMSSSHTYMAITKGIVRPYTNISATPSSNAMNVRCVKDEKTNTMTGTAADPIPAGYNFYVGAFWKADQVGERLIKMGVPAGDWTATVVEGADWVKLDQRPSEDPAIWTDSPAPMLTRAEDARYQVGGSTATTVTGNVAADGGTIYFRVGLKSYLPGGSTAAPRYGVILLTYKNNTLKHKIYLRQGEEPDFLMRPGDAGTGVGTRSLAVKWSPYNLTHPTFKSGSALSLLPATVQPSPAGSYLTDYPSQAGAFYQWSPTDALYAFNPSGVATPAVWSVNKDEGYWGGNSTRPGYTTTKLSALYETCPIGYRRPTDGSATNTVAVAQASITAANSEVGQSLYVNPTSNIDVLYLENSLWGYYADGFFDRRTIGTQPSVGGSNNTAVAFETSCVAHLGRLFYNPNNNGSLFLPAPGLRINSGGIVHVGFGYYWTSSSGNINDAYTMVVYTGGINRSTNNRELGLPIRCVKP